MNRARHSLLLATTAAAPLDQWRVQAAYSKDLTLVHNRPLVTFRTSTYLDDPAVGIVHDRAYWASAIRSRTSAYADVSLETHACGGSIPTLTSTAGAGTQVLPYVSSGQALTGATCLGGGSFAYEITTDGPVTIHFSDGRALGLAGAGEHTGTR